MKLAITVNLVQSNLKIEDVLAKDATIVHRGVFGKWEAGYVLPPQKESVPAWINWIQSSFGDFEAFKTRSARGLVFCEGPKGASSRLFLLPFGSGGRWLFDHSKVEHDFGVKVVASHSKRGTTNAIDLKTHDGVARATRHKAAKALDFDSLDWDGNRDMIQALSGIPTGDGLGGIAFTVFSGADSLKFTAETKLTQLLDAFPEFVKTYQSGAYKKELPELDNYRVVRNKAKTMELDQLLLERIVDGRQELLLDPRENLDQLHSPHYWAHITEDIEYDEPTLAKIASELTKSEELKGQLTPFGVYLDYEEERRKAGNLYSSITAEIRDSKNGYVLQHGIWHEISLDFLKELNEFVKSVPLNSFTPPEPRNKKGGEFVDEEDFNKYFVEESKKERLLLDRKLTKIPGQGKGIELCDALTKKLEMLVAKVGTRASGLSHMFAQGRVAVRFLRDNAGARDRLGKADEVLTFLESEALEKFLRGEGLKVSFAVLKPSDGKTTDETDARGLSFFNRINLRATTKELRRLGAQVSLSVIPVQFAD